MNSPVSERLISPDELDLAQDTFNEAELYTALKALVDQRPAERVLDVCCATGLASLRCVPASRVSSLTLVDIDASAVGVAVSRLSGIAPVVPQITDAVTSVGDDRYDLVLANSAYHHIENARKGLFLARLAAHLNPTGQILIGDHFLPEFVDDDAGLSNALDLFYEPLLVELTLRGTSEVACEVVRKSVELARRREVEFKVSWSRFVQDVADAGLIIDRVVDVWQPGPPESGSKAVRLLRAS